MRMYEMSSLIFDLKSSFIFGIIPLLTIACSSETTKSASEPTDEGVVLQDEDGDGYYNDEDCDDTDDNVNLGAIETCDGIDNNCDGNIDEGVTDTFYQDEDGDGFGASNKTIEACESPDGFVNNANDCDDTTSNRYPGGIEICDGIDNDCNSDIDDGVGNTYYIDNDGDGYGNPNQLEIRCTIEDGLSELAGDCDDENNTIYPEANEYCDGLDNDCNEIVDDGGTFLFFADADNDGFGDADEFIESCSPPQGYVSNDDDCDDIDTTISPTAIEICDGIDNNCNNQIDTDSSDQNTYYQDNDGDGFGNPDVSILSCSLPENFVSDSSDCDDENILVNPSVVEICDSIDNNCNSIIDNDASDKSIYYEDSDGDGFGKNSNSILDCVQPEGYALENDDCDDTDASAFPTASEICDDIDNNCNALTDEFDPQLEGGITYYLDYDQDGFGNPNFSQILCSAQDGFVVDNTDCDDLHENSNPDSEEICDGRNNDCDEDTDEDVQNTYYFDNDGDGYGVNTSLLACSTPEGYAEFSGDCNDNNDAIYPTAEEVCDGIDNNCDALGENGAHQIDEGLYHMWYLDIDQDGYGTNANSFEGCEAPSLFVATDGDCNDNDALYNPGASLGCHGEDYNCDGKIDNDIDEDGFPSAFCGGDDCNDNNDAIFPNTDEIWYDGIDQNCDDSDDYDQDEDGFVLDIYADLSDLESGDCDDEDSFVRPDPAGGCAYGETCLDIYNSYPDFASGSYYIDPDGWGGGLAPFVVYCDMDTSDPGWTEIPYAANLPITDFTGGDGWRWLPNDFSFALSDAQIMAIKEKTTEGKQDYVGLCDGVLHYQYHSNGGYGNAFGFEFYDGTETPFGQASYSPYDITVVPYPDGDGCYTNGGEGNSLDKATIFNINSPLVPIRNVYSRDSGDPGETFSSPLIDNPAWLR